MELHIVTSDIKTVVNILANLAMMHRLNGVVDAGVGVTDPESAMKPMHVMVDCIDNKFNEIACGDNRTDEDEFVINLLLNVKSAITESLQTL